MKRDSPPRRKSWRPSTVEFLGSFPGQPPVLDLPEVAFLGRSNVGKSSAINALLGQRKAARVSRTPGRTQAINLFKVDERYSFADLPGYGFAKAPEAVRDAWRGMIEEYLSDREQLRAVVLLVDSRHGPQKLDLGLIVSLSEAEIPIIGIATKVDKLSRNKRAGTVKKLAQDLGLPNLLPLSSPSADGVDGVLRAIAAACAG